jgi:hypothetical protein
MASSTKTLKRLSPELVLVDPHLALQAREALADPEAELFPCDHKQPSAEIDFEAAMRRLNDLAAMDAPIGRRSHRPLKLLAAAETWSLVAVLVAQTYLHSGI